MRVDGAGVSREGAAIRIAIEDDGVGFAEAELGAGPSPAGGIGLFSIRERLKHLGGRLESSSAPGRGSRMTVVVPLDGATPEAER